MKVLAVMFQQESNSFSPVKCGMEMFKNTCCAVGEEIFGRFRATETELWGAITALTEEGAAVIPSIAAQSVSSGPVTAEMFDYVSERVMKDILKFRPDGIFISLHGAMLADGYDDGTGEFLRRLREYAGEGPVIAGSLDFHANVTCRMVRSADILVGYRTYPHTDLFDTGLKAAKLMMGCLKERIRPAAAMVKLPMIVPGEACQTSSGPMKKIIGRAMEWEKTPGILAASVFQMQPWLDVYDAGCSVMVIADNDPAAAKEASLDIAEQFWHSRNELKAQLWAMDDIIRLAREKADGPVILADSADGTGSGSPGDGTYVFRSLLEHGSDLRSYITIVDSAAVSEAIRTGAGNEGEFTVGGSLYKHNNPPVRIRGRVRHTGDGKFVFKGPQFTGMEHHMGRTAVVQCRNIFLVIMEKSAFNWDPELYRSVGLEPAEADLVVVKSPNAFKAAYAGISSRYCVVDAPGPSSPKIVTLPYRHLKHPIYPFELVNCRDVPGFDICVK